MGSFSELYISNYPIFSVKNNYYDTVVEMIFLKADFKEYERPLNQRNEITWGDAYSEDNENETVKSFCSTVRICKERLELFGASYDRAKSDFNSAIGKLREEEDQYEFVSNPELNYESYLINIKNIIESKEKKLEGNPYSNFEDYLHENELLIENQSIQLGLWSILSVVDPEELVEYELTDVINGGWIGSNPEEEINIEKIIVLTEGKTDSEFIQNGLEFFYPHLVGYYHFMDFENSRYEANASRLVHTIKSFVGSGIKNLIIALFDNDTAGTKEIKNLRKVKLPSNIKVLQYPEIEWAKHYPTIGPSGIQKMNINGLAGSIEVYLGLDCIKENGELIPIQWTGYVEILNQYQGVILKKNQIQKRFRDKVKEFDSGEVEKDNWLELLSIIDLMNKTWN